MTPFHLHRRLPYLQRLYSQRDLARRQVERLTQETARLNRKLSLHTDRLHALPWYSVDLPPEVADSRPMIGDDERRLLYTLTRDFYQGEGRIIDGGTYIGDSSLALGFGLKARGYQPTPVIDAFDLFILIDTTDGVWFASDGDVKGGQSIRPTYDRRTASVAQYIKVHEGDVTSTPWRNGPIEILFNDLSKSWDINDYVLRNWFPCLMQDRSILIQQDQVQEYHVWVAITMEMLSAHFQLIDYVRNSSAVYRPVSSIGSSSIIPCLRENLSHDDMERAYLSWIERFRRLAAGRFKSWHLAMVEGGLIVTYALHIGDMDKARHAWKVCVEKFRDDPAASYRLQEVKRIVGL